MTDISYSRWQCGYITSLLAGPHNNHYCPIFVQQGDYKSEERRLQQKVHDYAYMRPYCSIEDIG